MRAERLRLALRDVILARLAGHRYRKIERLRGSGRTADAALSAVVCADRGIASLELFAREVCRIRRRARAIGFAPRPIDRTKSCARA